MSRRLAVASGVFLAAAAIAAAGTAYADDLGDIAPPVVPAQPQPPANPGDTGVPPGVDQAGQVAAAAPVGATQASSIGTSIGSSMAMMGPMMGMYVPLMAAPMLLQALPGLAQASAANGADPAVDAGSAAASLPFGLGDGEPFSLAADAPVATDLPADLPADLDLAPVFDPTDLDLPGIAADTADHGLQTGGDVTCGVLGLIGLC